MERRGERSRGTVAKLGGGERRGSFIAGMSGGGPRVDIASGRRSYRVLGGGGRRDRCGCTLGLELPWIDGEYVAMFFDDWCVEVAGTGRRGWHIPAGRVVLPPSRPLGLRDQGQGQGTATRGDGSMAIMGIVAASGRRLRARTGRLRGRRGSVPQDRLGTRLIWMCGVVWFDTTSPGRWSWTLCCCHSHIGRDPLLLVHVPMCPLDPAPTGF